MLEAYLAKKSPTQPIHWGNTDLKGIPIRFNGERLATLAGVDNEENQDLAAQMACLLHWKKLGADETALIELDTQIEELHQQHTEFDWTGIYALHEGKLHVLCFRGHATPHEVIEVNSGICGAAVNQNESINIADVSADARYLSCDFRTKSELVVPIRENGEAIAEIDIDSHHLDAFTPELQANVEQLAKDLSSIVVRCR